MSADVSVLQAIEDDYSHSEGELQDAEEKPNPDIQLGSELIYSRYCPVPMHSVLTCLAEQAFCVHGCLNLYQLVHILLCAMPDAQTY